MNNLACWNDGPKFRRLNVSIGEEPKNLACVPALDRSIKDKVLAHHMPHVPALGNTIKVEIPPISCVACGCRTFEQYRMEYGNPVHSWESGVRCTNCQRVRIDVGGGQ